MRARLTTIVAATAILLVPLYAAADAVEDQLRLMNERMTSMEDQLQATQDQLEDANVRVEQQQDILEKAGLERQAQSGLSAFLSETQFSGHIASSYSYNFNNPDSSSHVLSGTPGFNGGRNSNGALGITAPFHGQSNNFQLDQFYLAMQKPATPESRGGWMFSLAWGESADVMNGNGFIGDNDDGELFVNQTPYIHRAYVEYLADVGSGVNIRLGRWGTPVGAESFLASDNFNITRGLLWALQPVDHTGIEVSGACDCGIDWSLAAANSYSNTNLDSDNEKTFVGHVGYTAETWGASVNGVYGGNLTDTFYGNYFPRGRGTSREKVSLLDVVLTADPTDNLSLWLNFDYYWTEKGRGELDGQSSLTIWGVAAAGRYALTDRTGLSIRYEYLALDDAAIFFEQSGALFGAEGERNGADVYAWSVTSTLDHALTDNLTLKLEARIDQVTGQGTPDYAFLNNHTDLDDSDVFKEHLQVLGLVQLLYRF